MQIELVPDPGPADPAARAAVAALARERYDRDQPPAGMDGAWRRAGVEEAVDRNPSWDGSRPRQAPGHAGTSPLPG